MKSLVLLVIVCVAIEAQMLADPSPYQSYGGPYNVPPMGVPYQPLGVNQLPIVGSPFAAQELATAEARIRQANIDAQLRANQAKLMAQEAIRKAEMEATLAGERARLNANNIWAQKAQVNMALVNAANNNMAIAENARRNILAG